VTTRRKRQFPYRKVDDLEQEIAETEARIAQLEVDLGSPDVHRDGNRIRQTRQDYDDSQKQLARLYEHWEEAVELN
jgi:ATP-binding cassette subfamily F protein 3